MDLDDLLGDLRLPFEESPAERKLREAATVESPSWARDNFGRKKPYAPFAKRGLLIGFDGEGEYFLPGSHATLLRYVLARAGLPDAPVEEKRTAQGFELSAPGGSGSGPGTSDYAEAPLVAHVADRALAHARAPLRLLQVDSDDQGSLFVLVPAAARDRIAAALGDFLVEFRG